MTVPLASYADIEAELVAHLPTAVGIQTVTVTPADLQARVPLHRVTRVGGPDDGLTDTARVDVLTFASTRRDVWAYAEHARQAVLALPGQAAGQVLVDAVATEAGPSEIPWSDSSTLRVIAMTFRIDTRRPR